MMHNGWQTRRAIIHMRRTHGGMGSSQDPGPVSPLRYLVLPALLMKRGMHGRRGTGLRLLGLILLPGVLTITLTAAGGHHHGGSPPTTTTSTTTTTTKGSGSGIALGFTSFQPTPPDGVASYQSAIGSLPDFYEWFEPWPNSEAGAGTTDATAPLYLASQASMMESDHLTPIISWGTNDIPLIDIVNGDYDAYLADTVALVETYPGNVYIRLDWEMNGTWSGYNPYNSDQPAGTTPATFVAMWQHIVSYFQNAGVTNVKWIWAPNVDGGLSGCDASGSTTGCMAQYYPGNAYVNYVGLDGYNDASVWQTPQQIFAAPYSELEGITSDPVIITETSSLEATSSQARAGDSKATWIGQLASYLPALGNIAGVCWFNQTALLNNVETNFQVDTSASALSAWKSDFVSNTEYQGALP